jgi:GDPmannose 4,6-dehydratase
VVIDPELLRPAEPVRLCGDATRARTRLGWAPTHDFATIVREMVAADLDRLDEAVLPAAPAPGTPAAPRHEPPG